MTCTENTVPLLRYPTVAFTSIGMPMWLLLSHCLVTVIVYRAISWQWLLYNCLSRSHCLATGLYVTMCTLPVLSYRVWKSHYMNTNYFSTPTTIITKISDHPQLQARLKSYPSWFWESKDRKKPLNYNFNTKIIEAHTVLPWKVLMVSVVPYQLLLLACDLWKALALELGLDVPGCKGVKSKSWIPDTLINKEIVTCKCLNLLEFFQFLIILPSLSSCHVNVLLLLLCW